MSNDQHLWVGDGHTNKILKYDLNGKLLYSWGETGETIVLKAGRTPTVLARNVISGRILASPAVSQRRLFIRTDDQVMAIGEATASRSD